MADKFFGASLGTTTKYFFDRAKVVEAMDRKTNAAFNWIGGTLRKTAQRSIRKSTGKTLHSPPGSPVRTSTGIYPKTILYEFNPRTKTLICGPKKLPIKSNVSPGSRKSIPELLEKGGTGIAGKPSYRQVRPTKKKRGQKRKMVWVTIPAGPRRYAPRPTMGNAYKKTINSKNLKRAFETIGFRF